MTPLFGLPILPVLLAATLAGDTLRAPGLRAPVEIIRDRSGISHIYAKNEHDLFFAQGYSAARDRLFQLELWRRQATGTMSELLGKRELERDIGTRLFKYRGDLAAELASYHPHGVAIVGAFVEGVNAYIDATEHDPSLLSMEFKLLGTKPGKWTPDVVISRHQGLLGNVEEELTQGRAVAAIGASLVKQLSSFRPGDPDMKLDTAINGKLLIPAILAKYQAFHSNVRFQPTDVVIAYRNDTSAYRRLAAVADSAATDLRDNGRRDIGSNNWVISGRLSESGRPLLANDPHRAQSAPSLRYWVHLNAPGWNVVGGGEPEIPGISIGHNDVAAWGLTIFATDGEDLYVYKTNPKNRRQYWYQGAWTPMHVIHETIPVKGQSPVGADLVYTRHGPVVYEDSVNNVAYAVRAAWLQPGSAPYMASLRMDQATTWEQFRDACSYSNIPGENMIYADKSGNIGWQSVGIAPIRKNFSGLVPVPGDGRYEWSGFLPIKEKPHSYNPPEGFIATANNDLIPIGYPHMDAVGFVWADPYRWARISEVLGSGRKFAIADLMRLQTDYTSIPARQLVPLLRDVPAGNDAAERARQTLLHWDFVLDKSSSAAGLYEAWYRHLSANVASAMVPAAARPFIRNLGAKKMIDFVISPPAAFGANPVAARDSMLIHSLDEAVAEMTKRFGANSDAWAWGQNNYHHATITHPMSAAVDAATRAKLDVGPAPRGGDANTVGATGGGDNQTSGASFRMVVDLADWESAVGINTPGQSGNPDDPHYRDLFPLWANDRYFGVPFSKDRVAANGSSTTLMPR
ncbi:MAG TPA: penicillin acylase family protein [Gemmatimonadaceae bacterium]|jgi:penicillin amidase